MKKNFTVDFVSGSLLFLFLFLHPLFTIAQSVGINTDGSTPDASAMLDVRSDSKGLLIPRLTTAQRTAIATPATGLIVFDTNTNSFWYYSGAAWTNLASGWSLAGNTGTDPSIHFIGTTDNVPLVVKVDNARSGLIDPSGNSSWGFASLYYNSTGTNNTATGAYSLFSNTTGTDNTANGFLALLTNTGGSYNTANGAWSLYNNTTGSQNTATGFQALTANTTGNLNTANGYATLRFNTTGRSNTANGVTALYANTTGSYNMANGGQALTVNTSGSYNTASGYSALQNNMTGNSNTAYGSWSLSSNLSGANNTATGYQAMLRNSTGSNNTAIGAEADVSTNNLTNATAIGYAAVADASNKVRIGNPAVTVIEGQVPFTTPSDGRFKYQVQEDVKGLDFILQLRPVTYRFDVQRFDKLLQHQTAGTNKNMALQAAYDEAAAIRRTGFIAQEVEKAAMACGYNFSGIVTPNTTDGHYSLSYESFVVPLVKAVQELNIRVEKLEKENEALKKLEVDIIMLKKSIQELTH